MRKIFFLLFSLFILLLASCAKSVPQNQQAVTKPPPQTTQTAKTCPLTPEVVKEYCTVRNALVTTQAPFATCMISVDQGTKPPLIGFLERPWNPKYRELATTITAEIAYTGEIGILPSWDESLGDEAFITPFYHLRSTKAQAEAEGFNLYIKKGDTVYQLVSYAGVDRGGTNDFCNIEDVKEIAKDIIP